MYTFKNILSISIISLSTLAASCRNSDIPEDIHEHEEANRVTLTVTESGTGETQVLTYQTGSGADKDLILKNGKTYNCDVKFLHVEGTHSEDLTEEIIEEKDEHFLEYAFGGVDVTVTRSADDVVRGDQKKLGLKTQWKVTSAPVSARGQIRLVHGAQTVDDAANNGGGSHTGGDTDVDVSFNIK